jgi:hypothetical protein
VPSTVRHSAVAGSDDVPAIRMANVTVPLSAAPEGSVSTRSSGGGIASMAFVTGSTACPAASR